MVTYLPVDKTVDRKIRLLVGGDNQKLFQSISQAQLQTAIAKFNAQNQAIHCDMGLQNAALEHLKKVKEARS